MIESPPRPSSPDEREALIREARDRQRRRRILLAVAVAVTCGLGLALWAAVPSGGVSVFHAVRGPVNATRGRVSAGSSRFRGMGDVGTGGGVTWAISGRGFWLTTNDGRTWRRTRLPSLGQGGVAGGRADPRANIADVQFLDRRHGWVTTVGHSRIYRTSDGGRSWRVVVPPGCPGVCEGGAIDFLDLRHGYALLETPARDNAFFRTSDGGRTWQLVSRPTAYGLIAFTSSGHGFAFGGPVQLLPGLLMPLPPFGNLYVTNDGGRTWSRLDIGGSSSFVEQPFGVFGQQAVVVQNAPNPPGGVELRPSAVYVSPDAGRSWVGHPIPLSVGVPPAIDIASPLVWVFPSRWNLFLTADAGRHWRKISLLRGLPRTRAAWIAKVAFSSRRIGWAILDRHLFRTTDGGLHWKAAGPRKPKPRKHA